jgi:N-methylhydantoinase B/oxoprolinase/acetone carboxylase alpha subunit
VTVDFTGSSAQAIGPTNSAYGMTWSSTFNALLQLSPPDMPFNSGCFRPVNIVAPRHTLVSPQPPAAVFAGTVETSLRTIDAIVGALIKAVPDDFVAATYGTAFCFAGGGHDPLRRSSYLFFFSMEGGWGGSSTRDGWSCVPNQTSNFKDTPVEVVEQQYPFRCDEVSLRLDSGGAGRNRGGLGTIRSYTVLAGELTFGCYSDRFRTRPYGVFGGFPGASNSLLMQKAGSDTSQTFQDAFGTVSPSKFADARLAAGDRFMLISGGGGGYGDPLDRETSRVLDDVLEELVSEEQARDSYGVIFAKDRTVDERETRRRRAALRKEWRASPPFTAQGALTFDDEYVTLTKVDSLVVPAPIDESSPIIRRARDIIDESICSTSCARGGDPRVCPWHAPSALEFLSVEVFTTWSKAHCPQERALISELES